MFTIIKNIKKIITRRKYYKNFLTEYADLKEKDTNKTMVSEIKKYYRKMAPKVDHTEYYDYDGTLRLDVFIRGIRAYLIQWVDEDKYCEFKSYKTIISEKKQARDSSYPERVYNYSCSREWEDS